MKIIIAGEYSGIIREAFKAKGHDAWSCDLIDTEIPGQHLIMDNDMHLKDTLYNKHWDMMIGHPPCTRICNSGVLRLYKEGKKINGTAYEKWEEMFEACMFFKMMLFAPIKKKCIENPIPHVHAMLHIREKYSQIIQPYNFGENATKATCLWLIGLPLLKNTVYFPPKIINGKKRWANQSPSGNNNLGSNDSKARAKTYPGIANAMADQWNF